MSLKMIKVTITNYRNDHYSPLLANLRDGASYELSLALKHCFCLLERFMITNDKKSLPPHSTQHTQKILVP